MKKTLLAIATFFAVSTTYAVSVTCTSGVAGTEGVKKVVTSQGLSESIENGVVYENGNTRYLLTFTDILDNSNPPRVVKKNALVLTVQVNGAATLNMVSDGKRLLFFDAQSLVGVACERTRH